ncbi:MAG: hypothetical protein ACRDT6_26150 [Micromonosporaceae bacterium]
MLRNLTQRQRPIIVPSTALVIAAGAGWINPIELDRPAVTVTGLSQAIAPAVAIIISEAHGKIGVDVAHAAYEAVSTGHLVLTADSSAYVNLPVMIDVEEIPG